MTRRLLATAAALALARATACLAQGVAETRLEIDFAETAGICGFRPLWDLPVPLSEDGSVGMVRSPFHYGDALDAYWLAGHRDGGRRPGGLGFDAVHRGMLVRFPTCAEQIARRLNEGRAIAKIELELPFRATELWPEYYREPEGLSFLGDSWSKRPPRWHAVGWVLRRPWASDPERGPTFNSNINGLSYWAKYGAQDTASDRYPDQFGPAEVSSLHPTGLLDLTAVAADERYGRTIADRLAVLNDQGVLVRKWETYDASYWGGGYEFATCTGPRAILIHRPRLIVTFAPAAPSPELAARPAFSLDAAVARLKETGPEGRPTAVIPSEARIREFARTLGFVQPAWMPDWQWARVRELNDLGGGFAFPSNATDYGKWLDEMLGTQPRRWSGFDAPRKLTLYRRYQEAWPDPVRDHWKLYWSSWLQPDRPWYQLVQGYTAVNQARAYYEATGDWRGNFSVYRTYCRAMGPMDFNHWAVAGTLIGGDIIGSRYAVDDGRYGLALFPLHTWSWADGSTQESIDHYYFAITLAAQKVFADYGPTAYDRLIGKAILTKSVEELASCFHPGLRRFIATSTRTGVAYLLAEQDGLQHIMHAISPGGALTDYGAERAGGIGVLGHDVRPGEVAQLSLSGPWAPDWVSAIVGQKPIPSKFLAHGEGQWRQTYLGTHYGLASRESSRASAIPAMAQWRRAPETVRSMTGLGTLLIRYGINRTEFLDSIFHGTRQMNPNGIVGDQGGHLFLLQEKNKLIALSSPVRGLDTGEGRPVPAEIDSLQLTVGIYNPSPKPDWEIYIDGRRAAGLPARARALQRITIKDGVSFLGIVPLPATDLGRSREVTLSAGGNPTRLQGGGEATEALRIDLYNFDRPASAPPLSPKSEAIGEAWAGFAIEVSDQSEFPDFDAFQRHFASARVRAELLAGKPASVRVRFDSGGDRLEMGFVPSRGADMAAAVSPRLVNGRSPFPPPGIVRDGPIAQQGTAGRLEKNGAVLLTDPGAMGYLAADRAPGTVAAFNVPSGEALGHFELRLPGGAAVTADGGIGIAYAEFRQAENGLRVDQGYSPAQGRDPGRARRLIVSGLAAMPKVRLNGADLPAQSVLPVSWRGEPAFAVPLGAE